MDQFGLMGLNGGLVWDEKSDTYVNVSKDQASFSQRRPSFENSSAKGSGREYDYCDLG